jgi:hypothetical protein
MKWSRLIAGTSLAPGGNKGSSNNPEKRLARFKREYNGLLVSTLPPRTRMYTDALNSKHGEALQISQGITKQQNRSAGPFKTLQRSLTMNRDAHYHIHASSSHLRNRYIPPSARSPRRPTTRALSGRASRCSQR